MKLAWISAFAHKALDDDLPILLEACAEAGIDAQICCWDDQDVNWQSFDAAILRSTWDYSWRLEAFNVWLDRVAASTRLFNPVELVRWNLDKRYLNDLAERQVPTIATRFIEPGAAIDISDRSEFVIKPSVGAGARDAGRFARGRVLAARRHVAQLHAQGKTAMVQPYLAGVESEGETGMMFWGGNFSHAIRKSALLPSSDSSANSRLPFEIAARIPRADELKVAELALAALPQQPLYARVDVLRDDLGQVRLLELELTEPSLFLSSEASAATRFIDHIKHTID
jgi:hypothetical protein